MLGEPARHIQPPSARRVFLPAHVVNLPQYCILGLLISSCDDPWLTIFGTAIMTSIQKVAVIGCCSIGASWAALFLAQGLSVTAFDVNPGAETFLRTLIGNSLPILQSTGLLKKADVKADDIIFTTNLALAAKGADIVQENGPEQIDGSVNSSMISRHMLVRMQSSPRARVASRALLSKRPWTRRQDRSAA